MKDRYTDEELLYAARTVCDCGAGLAYPLDHADARELAAWACSRILKREVEVASHGDHPTEPWASRQVDTAGGTHVSLPFWGYSVKSESQVLAAGATTRPAGSHVELEPACACLRCGHAWKAPRRLPAGGLTLRGEAFDCPACGAPERAANGSLSGAVDVRFRGVVVRDAAPEGGDPR